METIQSFLHQYQALSWTILSILIISFAIWKMWEKVSFWVLRVQCQIPLIGKIARLSKNQAYNSDKGWFSSERELCAGFQPYYAKSDVNPDFFNDCSSYLRKVQETGRKKLSLMGWALISIMVFIEAMGFSFVLAGWTIPGASEALKEQGAFGIAILISGLLVFMTHYTGHELHNNSLINKVTAWFNMSESTDTSKKIPNTQVDLPNEQIDNDDPQWMQLLSRLQDVNHTVTPTFKVTTLTIIFIVLIATGSTYVRGQVLEKMIGEENLHPQTSTYNDNSYMDADPYAVESTALSLPAELVDSQKSVDEVAKSDGNDTERKGGWMTFIMLAVIFIFLQIMGIVIGYKSGFAGKESAKAKAFIGRFRTSDEFAAYHERKRDQVAQIAQKYLETLQAKMVKIAEKNNIDRTAINHLRNTTGRSFYAYVSNSKSEKNKHEDNSDIQDTAQKHTPTQSSEPTILLSEDEIETWMAKLNWDREKTIALLKEHKKKEQGAKNQVSDEDALAMLSAQKETVSDDDALALLQQESEVSKA